MTPLVSIVIPTKNRRELLRKTIASVVAQTYPNWEAIVVDDGSNDRTEEMVQSIASTDKRVRFVRRERKPTGASTCRNTGLSSAKGEYVVFLDSDDLLAPSCLERRIEVMETNPKIDFAVFPTWVFHDEPGDTRFLWNTFKPENDLDRFVQGDPAWQTAGPIWRRTSLGQDVLWDERALCAQDWEFHVRALVAGLDYIKIPEPDSFWRTKRPGAMGSSWESPRHVCSRVRLHNKVATILDSKGLLTGRRRRMLAGGIFIDAFRYGVGRRLSLKIWRAGRRAGIVGNCEFIIMLSSEVVLWMARRANRFCEHLLFPHLKIPTTQFKLTTPVSNLNHPAPVHDSNAKPFTVTARYES
jgi:glycosyltransferase involved in cell wall biosynthesis